MANHYTPLNIIFDYVFNVRKMVPLVPSDHLLEIYKNVIHGINKDSLVPSKNPALLFLIKGTYKERDMTKPVPLHCFKDEYIFLLLNAFRFHNTKTKRRAEIAKILGIKKYHKAMFSSDIYGNNVVYDVRINYRYDNLPKNFMTGTILSRICNLKNNHIYIENLYYINRLRVKESGFKREKFLKRMKVPVEMTSDKAIKYFDFVGHNTFTNLTKIMSKVAEKFYLTGSIIDYMFNTEFNPDNYKDSDIDIVITDKSKFGLLAGYLLSYYLNDLKIPMEKMNEYFNYDGKYITLLPGVFSHREIQIYCMAEKYCVFAHHFPCVRGYIDHNMRIRISQQAADIFRPDSDKVVKYIFIFPYTDVEKSKKIINKYENRGYVVPDV